MGIDWAVPGAASLWGTTASSATTQSAIGNGTVTLTGTGDTTKDAASATQVATLTSRDASTATSTVGPWFFRR